MNEWISHYSSDSLRLTLYWYQEWNGAELAKYHKKFFSVIFHTVAAVDLWGRAGQGGQKTFLLVQGIKAASWTPQQRLNYI